MKLVAFVGPKGSGKDTCASIAKEAGLVAGKISFAGPLKRICAEVFGIPIETFEHPVQKEESRPVHLTARALEKIHQDMLAYVPMSADESGKFGELCSKHLDALLISPRHVLQYVGTEIIRAYEPSWHCRAAFSPFNLRQLGIDVGDAGNGGGAAYAVTDCRFINEYDFLSREHDTTFFYVERPEAEEKLAVATHESERQILDVRALIPDVIKNDGTLDELKQRVLKAARKEGGL